VFGGSAWEWRDERQQYYLHSFVIQQADLNYTSPYLVEEMKVSENHVVAHISPIEFFVTLHI
jgi:glycosidase